MTDVSGGLGNESPQSGAGDLGTNRDPNATIGGEVLPNGSGVDGADALIAGVAENVLKHVDPFERVDATLPGYLLDPTVPLPEVQSFTEAEFREEIQNAPQPKVSLTFKELVSLNSDSSMRNTEHEGGQTYEWAAVLEKYLNLSDTWDSTLDIEVKEKALTFMQQLKDSRIDSAYNQNKIDGLVAEYQEKISRLAVNESMVIPGGYTLDGTGHAMVFMVTRESFGKYSFSIINSGDGIGFHPTTVEGVKTKYSPEVTYVDIPRSKISDSLLNGLFKINSNIKNETMSDQLIYELISMNFREEKEKSNYQLRDFITAQRSGTCALKAPLALLRLVLGKDSYKKLVYFISQDSLLGVIKGQHELSLGVEAGLGAKTYKDEQKCHTNRKLVYNAARNLMHKAQKKIIAGANLVDFKHDLLLACTVKYHVSEIEESIKVKRNSPVIEQSPALTTINAQRSSKFQLPDVREPDSIVVMPLVSVYPEFTSANQLTDVFFAELKAKCKSYEKYEAAVRSEIESFAMALPIGIKFFINGIEPNRLQKIMDHLLEIMQMYSDACPQSGVRLAAQKNTVYAIYALIQMSCSTIDPEMTKVFGCTRFMDLKRASNLFTSPEEYTRYSEFVKYITSVENGRGYFEQGEEHWYYGITKFDASKLEGQIKYFYQHYFIDNQRKIKQFGEGDLANWDPNKERDNGQIGYDLGKSFSLYTVDPSKDPLRAVCPDFRRLQKASLFFRAIEISSSGEPSVNFNCYNGSVSIDLNPSNYAHGGGSYAFSLNQAKSEFARDFSERIEELYRPFDEISEDDLRRTAANQTKEQMLSNLLRHGYVNHNLAPIDLIAFANEHISEFDDAKRRVHFEHQLFKASEGNKAQRVGDRLLEGQFIIEVQAFLKRQKATLIELVNDERIDSVLFLIRIATQLKTFLPADTQFDEYREFLTKYVADFLERLPISELNRDSQSKVYLHKALFSSLLLIRGEIEDSGDLFKAWLAHKHNPMKDEGAKREVELVSLLVQQRVIRLLGGLLPKTQGDFIKLSMAAFNEPCIKGASTGFTVTFENAAGKTAQVCLLTGNLHNYGSATTTPFNLELLYRDSKFLEIIDRNAEGYKCNFGPSFLEVKTSKGEYRVAYDEKASALLAFTIEKLLEDGSWVRQVQRMPSLNTYKVFVDSENKVVQCDIPYLFLHECDVWYAGDHLVFTSRETGKTLYTDTYGGDFKTVDGGKIYKSSSASLATRIESHFFSYVVRYDDGRSRLVFPRFASLEFVKKADADADQEWRLKADESFKLKMDSIRNIGNFKQYILLESETGKSVALIPELKFKQDLKGSENYFDLFSLPAGQDFNYRHANGWQVQELPSVMPLGDKTYTTISVVDGELSPSTSVERAICAYISLGMREYESAKKYLDQISIVDVGSSSGCKKKLEEFLGFGMGVNASPQGVALSFKAAYMVIRSSGKGGLNDFYVQYLDQLRNIPLPFKLNYQDEMWVLGNLGEGLPISERKRFDTRRELLNGKALNLRAIALFSYGEVDPTKLKVTAPEYAGMPPWVVGLNISTITYAQVLKSLGNSYQAEFSTLYNLCITVKKSRNNDDLFKIKTLLNTVILLSPSKANIAAFLLKVLTSESNRKYFDKGPNCRYGTDYQAKLDWQAEMAREHSLAGHQHTVPLNGAVREEMALAQLPGPRKKLTPLGAPIGLPVIGDDATKISIDEARVGNASFTELLHRKRDQIAKCCQQVVAFEDEANHFDGDSAKILDSVGGDLKWDKPEASAKKKFLEGYKETCIKRESRKVPSMSKDDLDALLVKLKEGKAERDLEVSRLERRLLLLANKCPDEEKLIDDIGVTGGMRKELSTTDLLYLFFFAEKDRGVYSAANPHLTQSVIDDVFHLSAQFFKTSVEQRQMNRFESTINKVVEKMESEGMGHTKDAFTERNVSKYPQFTELLYQLSEISMQNSVYDLKKNPERLVFEYAMEIMLRVEPDQISSLQFLIDAVAQGKNPTIQFRMGGGKTSVFMVYLLALIAAKKKDGKDLHNIPILMTPLFQLEAVEGMLRANLLKTYNVGLISLHLDREAVTLDRLNAILYDLEEIQAGPNCLSPKVLMVCPETTLVLQLEYYIRLKELAEFKVVQSRIEEEEDEEEEDVVREDVLPSMEEVAQLDPSDADFKKFPAEKKESLFKLQTILNKLKEYGVVLADETHIMLDITKELNFPIGEPTPVREDMISLVIFIGKILNREEFKGPLKLATNAQAKYFNDQNYRENILEKLTDEVAKYPRLLLERENLKGSLKRYIRGLINPELELEVAKARPVRPESEPDRSDYDFLKYLREELAASEDEDERIAAEMIALSKNVLSSMLPYLLSKSTANFNFGRTRDPKRPGVTVPYVTADTPSTNNFGNEVEELVKGILITIINKVEECQVTAIMDEYVKQAKFDMRLGLQIEESQSYQECQKNFDISPFEYEEKKEQVMAHVLADPDVMFFVQKWTFTEYLEKYKFRLNANPMTLVSLFDQFIAMSGTPPVGLFHHSLQQEDVIKMDRTVNSDVMHAFMSKGVPINIIEGDEEGSEIVEPEKILSEICKNPDFTGLLDMGGITKDMTNLQVAKLLLKGNTNPDIKAVVFFHAFEGATTSDTPAVLYHHEDTPKALKSLEKDVLKEKEGLEAGNYFLSLDKRHCVGIDAPAMPDARFAVTWDVALPLSDATQGLARLRKLDNGQLAQAYIASTEVDLFPEEEGRSFKDQSLLTKYKILTKQSLKMQGREDARNKLKSFRKMLENAVIQAITKEFLAIDMKAPGGLLKASEMIENTEKYIFISENDDLFALYGGLNKSADTLTVLRSEQDILLQKVELDVKEGMLPQHVFEKVKAEHEKIMILAEASKDEFVQTTEKPVSSNEDAGDALGVEVENQVQTEKQVEQLDEQERDIDQLINAMQRDLPLTFQEERRFRAETFINEQRRRFTGSTSSKPVAYAFTEEYGFKHERQYPFGKIFSPNLGMSTRKLSQFNQLVNPFDKKYPPIKYMVVFQDNKTREFKGVLVTRHEADLLKTEINSKSEKNIWLFLKGGELHAGDRGTLPVNEDVNALMLEFNILAGSLGYCFKKGEDYLSWFLSSPELDPDDICLTTNTGLRKSLKGQFIDMMYHLHRPLLLREYRDLIDEEKMIKRVRKEDIADIQAKFTTYTVEQIKLWGESQKGDFKYLTRTDHIKAVSLDMIKYLDPKQIAHVSLAQFMKLTRSRQIGKAPESIIVQLSIINLFTHRTDLKGKLFDSLTDEQKGYIKHKEVYAKCPAQERKYLNPEVFEERKVSFSAWGELTDAQIVRLAESSLNGGEELHYQDEIMKRRDEFDGDALDYLAENRTDLLTSKNISKINNFRIVLDLNDEGLGDCSLRVLKAAIKDAKCLTRLKKVATEDALQRLIEAGYRQFTDDQYALIKDALVVATVPAEKVHLLSEEMASEIPFGNLTEEAINNFALKLDISTQVELLGDDLLKVYLTKVLEADKTLISKKRIDSALAERIVKCGAPELLSNRQLNSIMEDSVFVELDDEHLEKLSNIRIEKIENVDLITKLNDKQLLNLSETSAKLIPADRLTIAMVDEFKATLSQEQVIGMDKKVLKATLLTDQDCKYLLEGVLDSDVLVVAYENNLFESLSDVQKDIAHPAWKEEAIEAKRLEDLAAAEEKRLELEAAEEERKRLELEAAEKERERLELEEAEKERELLELEAAEKERERLELEEAEKARLDEELEAEKQRKIEEQRRLEELAAKSPSPELDGEIRDLVAKIAEDEELQRHIEAQRKVEEEAERVLEAEQAAALQKELADEAARITAEQVAENSRKLEKDDSEDDDIDVGFGESIFDQGRNKPVVSPEVVLPVQLPVRTPASHVVDSSDEEDTRGGSIFGVVPPRQPPKSPEVVSPSASSSSSSDRIEWTDEEDDQPPTIHHRRPQPSLKNPTSSSILGPSSGQNRRPEGNGGRRRFGGNPPSHVTVSKPEEQEDGSFYGPEYIGGLSSRDLRAFKRKNKKTHAAVFQKVTDLRVISAILKTDFTDLTKDQVQLMESESDLLRLPSEKLDYLKESQIKKFQEPKLIYRLDAAQVKNVDPEVIKHISGDAVSGVDSKKLFKNLSFTQLRVVKSDQLQFASVIQRVAYSILTVVNTILSLILFPVVETLYYPSKLCSITKLDPAHKYVRGSIGRGMSYSWHCFKQTVLCQMFYKPKPISRKKAN